MGRCAYLLKKCADRRAESKIWACESFCRQDFLHLILRSVLSFGSLRGHSMQKILCRCFDTAWGDNGPE